DPAAVCEIDFEILRMRDLLEGSGEQLRFGIADQFAERPVDLDPAAVGRYQSHADRCMLERTGEALLAFAQRLSLLTAGVQSPARQRLQLVLGLAERAH